MSHDADARLLSNRILTPLPAEEHERLAPHFQYVELPLRAVLYRPDAPMPFVYFPLSGMVSLTAPMRDGGEVEVGVVGREGMAGLLASEVTHGPRRRPRGETTIIDALILN